MRKYFWGYCYDDNAFLYHKDEKGDCDFIYLDYLPFSLKEIVQEEPVIINFSNKFNDRSESQSYEEEFEIVLISKEEYKRLKEIEEIFNLIKA